jgi:hypothetical protein
MMRLLLALTAATLASSALVPANAAAQDPKVVPIQVTGDPAARFSLVIMGDGYTAADMPRYRAHLEKHLNILWSLEPFRSYRNYINVYSVEVVSAESGITCDPAHRQPRNTAIKLEFGGGCEDPNARGVTPQGNDNETPRRYARMATPAFDQILVIANSDTYGGIGGSIATTTGGNALSPYITPHELGHSLGRLQDEYTYSARGVKGRNYAGAEPNSVHHTVLTEEQMKAQQKKWFRWLGEPSESGGLIGRFEGGQQNVTGIWRPSKHSMMISLGYYFDQVSLERLTQRISAQVSLIAASTDTTVAVPRNEVIWIEPAHPVFHPLNITWEIDGVPYAPAANLHHLDLSGISTPVSSVRVRVVDTTPFVRDPGIRDSSFSASRAWRVDARRNPLNGRPQIGFLSSTQSARPISGREVVYVETTHPNTQVLAVNWDLNGRRLVPQTTQDRIVSLASLGLPAGTHKLTATVSNGPTLSWTIDNTMPSVRYTTSTPVRTTTDPDGTQHHHFTGQFTMKLEPSDDQPGYVVAEFRVDGDGWHHYYGWPDAPAGTPFLFTPRGTTIKELVYGSLSSEGLSPQPWETRAPGYGTHTIEYRARDAAGNIGDGKKFRVTVSPAR